MKQLKDILADIDVFEIAGTPERQIASIHFDSRSCEPGCLFVAVKGTQVDGHQFIDKAIAKGATSIICEVFPENKTNEITWIKVNDSAKALGLAASAFYDHPSRDLKLIGVTGTNGKTTIVNLLFNLVRKLGYQAGVLSTIENKIEDRVIGSTHTTPDPVQINKLMLEMVEAGCDWCFMECSSHAIEQQRISGLEFDGAIFTNITHDHLDYHKTFDAYIKAKKKFFDNLSPKAFALTNDDDRNGMVMVQNTRAQVATYALKRPADYKGRIIENQFEGLQININGKEIYTRLVGAFNAYNLLAVCGAAILSGEDEEEVLTALSNLNIVEGRFDYVRSATNITGIVDYAHTPDALKNVLETINAIRTMNESLITVVGAGGDRDTTKRPEMAKIAGRMSTRVILTSDNPRSEEPNAIIDQMRKGLEPTDTAKVIAITDRKEAIKTACLLAQPNDIILVAGKGHEKYQEIKGVKHPFDDKKILSEFLNLKPINN
ncbi:MAG TPA: UDP-N-acetylmuramoyl-L-alanyl-D-glutamate--2,6-diaminopimelate ligase [Bacteroidales bacterium]|nr:UDP-N-acetylmuramoyl-L-alanyl-D-glutamate--2,6-diaminopimelate ligase [Bacteroidales bacterium]HRX96801.1 UDP-N-acetylmuramoyl-L-alanyl-D-glutamate--2,6-diaminopimelate ligase [Bacteroidales bacterium]